ncbi:MAG TPA: hypothetical protein VFA91_01655, partial [Candidatus Polarisedimenticolia bacterium]|nr:hypothetical protein [Candidatus Polarisedimenticolia bacterium]
MLEAVGVALDDDLLAAWRDRIALARDHLGWDVPGVVARVHATGASLAIAAPVDLLYLATEVNEWAWCASVYERDPRRWAGLEQALRAAALADAIDPTSVVPPVLGEAAALERFSRLASREIRPDLRVLLAGAAERGLPYL